MKQRFYYGTQPSIKNYRPDDFSRKGYECTQFFQTKDGIPVMVFHSKAMDIWRVECGFFNVFFGTKAETLAYCKGRFFDQNGKLV